MRLITTPTTPRNRLKHRITIYAVHDEVFRTQSWRVRCCHVQILFLKRKFARV